MKHLFKAPAFQLYVKEFLQDEAVIAMDLEAVGGYIILLCHQWNEGSVPEDVSLMARICRTTPERMQKIWPQIAPRFSALRGNKNRLVNPKLEIVRNEKLRFSRKQANSGGRGAQKRWTQKSNDGNGLNGVAHESAIGSRWASHSSGSGSGTVNNPPTPSQEGAACVFPSDPDELPFATDLIPFPPKTNGENHNGNGHAKNGNGNGRPPKISEAIKQTAERIHARHPNAFGRRDCSAAQIEKRLGAAIVRHRSTIPAEELLDRVDRNHAAWCLSDAWRKDDGQFAKGLENWLAPTKDRYLIEPPATAAYTEPPRVVL